MDKNNKKSVKYSKIGQNYNKTEKMVLTAMFFAVAMILSIIEGSLPTPVPVPGVKMGLANIAVMYALFFFSASSALGIVVLKGFFIFMTRGFLAGVLSLTGGLLSLFVMIILIKVFKDKISYFILGVAGALSHNIGQYVVISIIYGFNFIGYLPVLLVFGMIAGVITSVLLKFILPALQKLGLK